MANRSYALLIADNNDQQSPGESCLINSVTESGSPAKKAKGLKLLRTTDVAAIFTAGSRTYKFKSKIQSLGVEA